MVATANKRDAILSTFQDVLEDVLGGTERFYDWLNGHRPLLNRRVDELLHKLQQSDAETRGASAAVSPEEHLSKSEEQPANRRSVHFSFGDDKLVARYESQWGTRYPRSISCNRLQALAKAADSLRDADFSLEQLRQRVQENTDYEIKHYERDTFGDFLKNNGLLVPSGKHGRYRLANRGSDLAGTIRELLHRLPQET